LKASSGKIAMTWHTLYVFLGTYGMDKVAIWNVIITKVP